jgi:hypothetical protein
MTKLAVLILAIVAALGAATIRSVMSVELAEAVPPAATISVEEIQSQIDARVLPLLDVKDPI